MKPGYSPYDADLLASLPIHIVEFTSTHAGIAKADRIVWISEDHAESCAAELRMLAHISDVSIRITTRGAA